jgi:hypothetical protein
MMLASTRHLQDFAQSETDDASTARTTTSGSVKRPPRTGIRFAPRGALLPLSGAIDSGGSRLSRVAIDDQQARGQARIGHDASLRCIPSRHAVSRLRRRISESQRLRRLGARIGRRPARLASRSHR